MHRMKYSLLLLIASLSLILMPVTAEAAFQQLYCDGAGGVGGGELFYADPNTNEGACQYRGVQHIFSEIVCDFVVILNDVMGKIYCGMQDKLQKLLAIILTLYIAVFGVQIVMGITKLNSKEIIFRMLKMAGVWAFVTQSTWGIGLAFTFFVGLITEGIWWTVNAIMPVMNPSSTDVMPIYAYLDQLIYAVATGPFLTANAKITGFFLGMMVAFPPVFMMALYWFWTMLTMLARTLISFLLGVSAIAFLIALSPIFLSFMLFQSTFHIFESWLRYMMSFSLQIVVIFACVAIWLGIMFQFTAFFNDLSNVVFPYQKVREINGVESPQDEWGVCPLQSPMPNRSSFPFDSQAVCQKSNFNPVPGSQDWQDLIEQDDIARFQEFLYYLVYHLLTLLLIVYAFNILLKNAPMIAKELVGPELVPTVGAGWGAQGFSKIRSMLGKGSSSGEAKRAPASNLGHTVNTAVKDFLDQARKQVSGRQKPTPK